MIDNKPSENLDKKINLYLKFLPKLTTELKRAFDKSVIIYDRTAQAGVLSGRLLELIYEQIGPIEFWVTETRIGISLWDDFYDYYINELNGSLPNGKYYPVLFFGVNGEVILGAY